MRSTLLNMSLSMHSYVTEMFLIFYLFIYLFLIAHDKRDAGSFMFIDSSALDFECSFLGDG